MLIQLILILILLYAFVLTWRRVREQAIRYTEGLLWSLVWSVAGLIVLRPEITSRVAELVGVGRGADMIVYAAIVVLLIAIFQLHVAHDRLERQLTELVRRDALRSWSQEDLFLVEDGMDDSV